MQAEQPKTDNKLTWVRLHLVPQTDNHTMPPFIVGILTSETATSFVLMKVIQTVETEEGWEEQYSPNMHFVNRTYVWCTETLAEPPQLGGLGELYNGDQLTGGLG